MNKMVACPHCGFEIISSFEDGDINDEVCFECEKPYTSWIEITVKTQVAKEPTK